ncbi:hypothetical protein [Clostridium butyricum]|jgi:hypothetical protein
MKKIIYSKYSNERDYKFQIRTDILRDCSGKKVINKTALTDSSVKHIENIYNSYLLLNKFYENSPIKIPKCIKKDSNVEIEFVEGRTLEEELDKYYEMEKYSEMLEKIKEYKKYISGDSCEFFRKSTEFIEIFGEANLSQSVKAISVSDIDITFSNIIIDEDWYIIDYEWTFNFLIPINFIVYRAIKVYVESSEKRHELINNIGLYKLLGITDSEMKEYEKMEKNFQLYVKGNLMPLNDIYKYLENYNFNIRELVERRRTDDYKNYVQVFYDYGDGFSEENSYKFLQERNNEDSIEFDIDIPINLKKIRIDPCNNTCIVKINNILGYGKSYYPVKYTTSGINISDDFFGFNDDDPQIILEDIPQNTKKIYIHLCIMDSSKSTVAEICNSLYVKDNELHENNRMKNLEIEKIKRLVESRNETIESKNKIIESKNKTIENIENKLKEHEKLIEEKQEFIDKIQNKLWWKIINKFK